MKAIGNFPFPTRLLFFHKTEGKGLGGFRRNLLFTLSQKEKGVVGDGEGRNGITCCGFMTTAKISKEGGCNSWKKKAAPKGLFRHVMPAA